MLNFLFLVGFWVSCSDLRKCVRGRLERRRTHTTHARVLTDFKNLVEDREKDHFNYFSLNSLTLRSYTRHNLSRLRDRTPAVCSNGSTLMTQCPTQSHKISQILVCYNVTLLEKLIWRTTNDGEKVDGWHAGWGDEVEIRNIGFGDASWSMDYRGSLTWDRQYETYLIFMTEY